MNIWYQLASLAGSFVDGCETTAARGRARSIGAALLLINAMHEELLQPFAQMDGERPPKAAQGRLDALSAHQLLAVNRRGEMLEAEADDDW